MATRRKEAVKNLMTGLCGKPELQAHELNSVKELTKLLQDPAFEANARDEQGNTPLHLLVKRPFEEKNLMLKAELIVCMLTYSSADMEIPDHTGNTPLHTAVKADEMEVVKILVAINANINAVNNEGKTPLDLALPSSDQATASPTDSDIAAFLVSCGAEHSGARITPKRYDFSKVSSLVTDDQTDWEGQFAQAYTKLEAKLAEKAKEILSADQDTPGSGRELARIMAELEKLKRVGGRVLCLDGGGIRGLTQLEMLSQLEKLTGKKVTELFDWIIGTSIGGIAALCLVHCKSPLYEVKQFYYRARYEALPQGSIKGFGFNTDGMIHLIQSKMGSLCMNDVKSPKVLIAAVDKSSGNVKLQFFNNCFNDDYSTQEIWKVARYTSAGPTMFKEMDNYVDGGVLAQNPSLYGISRIEEYYQAKGQKLPVSLVVSMGSGIPPDVELGNVDAQDFLSFGLHWFSGELSKKIGNLGTLLGNAIVYSHGAHLGVKTICSGFNIPYFRLDTHLPKAVATGETDLDTLISMVIATKTTCRKQVKELVEKLYENMEARADPECLKIAESV